LHEVVLVVLVVVVVGSLRGTEPSAGRRSKATEGTRRPQQVGRERCGWEVARRQLRICA
jgi:hypothetical protein